MIRVTIAGTTYFLLVFAAGFGLGVLRVIWVTPRLGELAATLLEVPVMVAIAFFICRWVLRHWQVPPIPSLRGAMALWFLVLLVLFEWQIGERVFGRTPAEQWATLATPSGLVGLFGQITAALLPVFLCRARNDRNSAGRVTSNAASRG
jgi:hypothetical protein